MSDDEKSVKIVLGGSCHEETRREMREMLSKAVRSAMQKHDPVEHPPHYTFGRFEVIDVIEDWQLGYRLGNCVKYIARAGRKNSRLEDLKKAQWYLAREIAAEEVAEELRK